MTQRPPVAKAVALAASLAVVLVAAPAGATIAVPLTRTQQACMSDLVVRASVVDQRFQWNEDHSQILTLTRVRVTQYLRGSGATELVVRQFGGRVGDMVSEIAGDGALVQGQEVVLFLRSGTGVVYLTAMAQSVYHVLHSPGQPPVVRRNLRDLAFTLPASGQTNIVEPPAEPDETLDHLLADLRALGTCAP